MLTDVQLMEIAVAAHQGGLLMDEKNLGWELRADPDTLRMSSVSHCMIGQTMPNHRRDSHLLAEGVSYEANLKLLGLTLHTQKEYGFCLPMPIQADGYDSMRWAALTEAWKNEIEDRLAVTKVDPVDVREPLVLAV